MHHNYFNCAAPKAKIAQNIIFLRRVHNELPSYPSNVRVGEPAQESSVLSGINVHKTSNDTTSLDKPKKISGILKNHKSCPVSPVHEELDWSLSDQANSNRLNVANPKRHTMYCEDAQNIIDKIQIDTEKMIAEITEKYGDLDEFEPPTTDKKPSCTTAKSEKCEHNFLSDEEANFSSDSLEECSLDLDYDKKKKSSSKQCKKHAKKFYKTPPRSVSEYFIYDDFKPYNNIERKVSLSDILNDERNDIANDRVFLESQRHSSASFFLSHPERKSQESILSDGYDGGDPVSFTNSMESILSDESECKSAPLEALFEKGRMTHKNIGKIDKFDNINSKSYGSSPNSTSFDYYMQNRYKDRGACDLTNYKFDDLERKSFTIINDGPINSPTRKKFSTTLSFSTIDYEKDTDFEVDYIPSSSAKTALYDSRLKKSLSKDFASQRRYQCEQIFQPKQLNQSELFAEPTKIVMKKSCSFEIDMGNGQKKYIRTNKFEQNLRRFEKDRKDLEEEELKMQKSDYNLEMGFVAHKPPVAHRRTSSMKNKMKSKLKMHYNTISTSQTMGSLTEIRDFVNEDYLHKMDTANHERIFELNIKEKHNFDNYELNCMDDTISSHVKFLDIESTFDYLELPPLPVDAEENKLKRGKINSQNCEFGFNISPTHLKRFRDIEKKIDVINKLVALEERKLQEERSRREFRVKPLFNGNTKERGFVKHLTKNFDKLAENGPDNISVDECLRRNYSLPDVLEGAKFQFQTATRNNDSFKVEKDESDRISNLKIFDFDEDYGEGVKIENVY